MSISTITVGGNPVTLVELPAKPGLKLIEWDYWDAVSSVRSIFTGQTQRQKWLGADKLSGMATMPPLDIAQADDWECFEMQLRGIANAFQMGDPLRTAPRGSGGAPPNAPTVDNTVAGGNAAGSETLGTQGWAANAAGVLKRGDWIQVGYRLYRALDDVNADGSGKALIPIWPSLREQPASDGVHSGWLNATGSLGYTQSRSLGNNTAAVRWSGFQLTPNTSLPADAEIHGIYPVMVASATHDQAFSYYTYGNIGANFTDTSEGNPFSLPSNPAGTSFASTEFHGGSIGTSLAAMAAYKIKALLSTSLNIDVLTDVAAVTAVAFAIDYTSATPVTDPQIPPPFTIPGGHGLAWALPVMVEQSGVMPGCSGFFCPSTGYALGTPITYNGGIILNGAKGLFSLASNKRSSSADPGRLSRTSFPFEEYR